MANNPDLFNSEDQDPAGDAEGTYIPPDEPLGSQSWGTTAEEEREGETFNQRSKHMNAEDDDMGNDSTRAGQLVQPGDEDVDGIDDESNTVALDEGFSVDGDYSAEEAAMHIVEDQS
jgi:hypothetical protein